MELGCRRLAADAFEQEDDVRLIDRAIAVEVGRAIAVRHELRCRGDLGGIERTVAVRVEATDEVLARHTVAHRIARSPALFAGQSAVAVGVKPLDQFRAELLGLGAHLLMGRLALVLRKLAITVGIPLRSELGASCLHLCLHVIAERGAFVLRELAIAVGIESLDSLRREAVMPAVEAGATKARPAVTATLIETPADALHDAASLGTLLIGELTVAVGIESLEHRLVDAITNRVRVRLERVVRRGSLRFGEFAIAVNVESLDELRSVGAVPAPVARSKLTSPTEGVTGAPVRTAPRTPGIPRPEPITRAAISAVPRTPIGPTVSNPLWTVGGTTALSLGESGRVHPEQSPTYSNHDEGTLHQ